MEARNHAGVGGDERNLARVLNDALREADACGGYALGAEAAGNERLADFFRDVQETYTRVAGRAEEMLGDGVKSDFRPASGRAAWRPGKIPATSRTAELRGRLIYMLVRAPVAGWRFPAIYGSP